MHTSPRRWFIVAILAASVLSPSAMHGQFAAGQKNLGVHVGLSGVGTAPSFGVNGDLAFSDRVSVGAWADTWGYGESLSIGSDSYRWDVRYIALAGTSAYHFPIDDQPKLDPFVGVSVGYFIVSAEGSGAGGIVYGGDSSRAFVGGFAGIRYAFRERLNGVARAGFGASHLTLGLDYRL